MPKILCQDYSDGVYVNASVEYDAVLDNVSFKTGKSIADKMLNRLTIIVESGVILSDFFKAGPVMVVSQKMKDILSDFEVEAEYFLLNVVDADGCEVYGDFFLLNLLKIVDCFDWDNSIFTLKKGFAFRIEKLVLREPLLGEPAMFLINKTIPVLIAAREDLAREIRGKNCTGIVFESVDNWRNPRNPV